MNIQLFSNNTESTLVSGILPGDLSLDISSAVTFPSITNGDWFYLTIDDSTNLEIVRVTALAGSILTIERAQQNTTSQTFASGASISMRNTSFDIFNGSPQAILLDFNGDILVDGNTGAIITSTQDTLSG